MRFFSGFKCYNYACFDRINVHQYYATNGYRKWLKNILCVISSAVRSASFKIYKIDVENCCSICNMLSCKIGTQFLIRATQNVPSRYNTKHSMRDFNTPGENNFPQRMPIIVAIPYLDSRYFHNITRTRSIWC